jgi:hypothetical protein
MDLPRKSGEASLKEEDLHAAAETFHEGI